MKKYMGTHRNTNFFLLPANDMFTLSTHNTLYLSSRLLFSPRIKPHNYNFLKTLFHGPKEGEGSSSILNFINFLRSYFLAETLQTPLMLPINLANIF